MVLGIITFTYIITLVIQIVGELTDEKNFDLELLKFIQLLNKYNSGK